MRAGCLIRRCTQPNLMVVDECEFASNTAQTIILPMRDQIAVWLMPPQEEVLTGVVRRKAAAEQRKVRRAARLARRSSNDGFRV